MGESASLVFGALGSLGVGANEEDDDNSKDDGDSKEHQEGLVLVPQCR